MALNNGLDNGVQPSGTYTDYKPELYFCENDPSLFGNDLLIGLTGSDIAWASSTGSFFIQSGTSPQMNGSTWRALQTS